jgi:hypothetical protein
MRAMLIFACFPLLGLLAQPLGGVSVWWPAILIGFLGACHQAWSANLFSTIGDMFPKSTIGTITGIGSMAGGIGSFLINKGSGMLFTLAAGSFLVTGGTSTEPEEMSVKNYKHLLTTELLAKGDMQVDSAFATLPDVEKATASFEKARKRGGSFFDEYATRAGIIENITGQKLTAEQKSDAGFIETQFNALPDKDKAEAEFIARKDYSAKAEIVVATLNSEEFKELAADGEKLAEAFQQHGCEVKSAPLHALGFNGKPAGYMIIFCICSVAYLIGWFIMKSLVPKYKPIVIED